MAKEDKEFQCLLKEYELHRGGLQFGIGHRLKGAAFILSAVIVALSLGIEDKLPSSVLLLIPWFIIGSSAYLGYQLFCTRMIITYLCELEKRLKVIDYERCIAYKLYWKPSFFNSPAILLGFISLLPFFFIFLYCLYMSTKWFFDIKYIYVCFNIDGCIIGSLYFIVTLAAFFAVVFITIWGVKRASHLPKNRFNNSSGEKNTI